MTPSTEPSVSVVIPTRNRRDRLAVLLDSLSDEPATEVVVVVNGSTDGSLALLEDRARRDPRILPDARHAAGKAAAQQRGVEMASGDVILMLDDDVVPEPGLIRGHARHHASRDGLVVVGYMPVSIPSPRRPGQYPIDLYARSYERVCGEYESDPRSILQGLWAGNVSVRRTDLLRVGLEPSGNMPAAYWYHQDRDFGLRCAEASLEGLFDRRLLARHDHRTTPEAYLRLARDSGHTRWGVHASHSEVAGALPRDFFSKSVPMPGRMLVRLAQSGSFRGPIQLALRALAKLAGQLHLFRIESHAGFILSTVEQQRGALEAATSMRHTESTP